MSTHLHLRRSSLRAILAAGAAFAALLALSGCGGSSDEKPASSQHPRLAQLRIVPREPFSFHQLRAAGVDFANAIGDLSAESDLRLERLSWRVNGQEVHRGAILESSYFNRDDIVELHLLGDDGKTTVDSDQVTILNSVPRVSGVSLAPARDEGDVLVCNVSAIDADNEEIQYEFEWLLDGGRFAGARGPRAALHDLKKGQRVEAIVRAFDGSAYSQPFRTRAFVIDNLPPTIAEVGDAVVRSMEDGKRIFRLQLRVDDPDGDELDVRFQGVPSTYDWNPESGILQWVFEGAAEPRTIQVRVSDGRGAAVQHQLDIAGDSESSR